MRRILDDLWRNCTGIWKRLDAGQRLVVGAVLLAATVGLGALLWFAAQPSYVVVFEPKNGEEMRTAKRLLSAAGVQFVPDETGHGIRVERSQAAAAKNAIFEGGLLEGADRSLVSSSIIEDAETKMFRLDSASRAQAELAIAGLAGVQSATVLASRPRQSPFRDRDRETMPRATVTVRLRPGVAFEALARSAASLAASQLMVPLENVEVFNAGNHQRWQYDPDREAGVGSSEFLAQQRMLADERTHLAQEALDALYPGKTVITVGVELDPEWQVKSEKVVPQEPLLSSEQSTKDSSETNDRIGPIGDPSTAANTADAAAKGPRNATKKEMRDRKFVTDIGETRSGKLAPEIKRLTVALLFDRSLEQKEGFDKQQLVAVVKSIVGWDTSRDTEDGFSTMSGDFPAVEPVAAGAGPGFGELALQWAPTVGQVLGVVLVLWFLRGLLRRPSGAGPRAAAATAEEAPPEELQKRMRREIERAIASDPAALAKLLENWLAEQKA